MTTAGSRKGQNPRLTPDLGRRCAKQRAVKDELKRASLVAPNGIANQLEAWAYIDQTHGGVIITVVANGDGAVCRFP